MPARPQTAGFQRDDIPQDTDLLNRNGPVFMIDPAL